MAHTGKETLWTRSFTLTMLGMLFLFIPFALYMPVLPAYLLQELHSSIQVAGAINGIFLAAAVLFRAQTARLEARFGVRRVLLASSFLFMATNVLYIAAGSVIPIMLIRFFSGACFAVANTSIMAVGSRLIPMSRKGEGLAYLTAMVLAGGAIGPYIGLSLARAYGYDAVFVFSTLSTLVGLLIAGAIQVHEEQAPVQPRFSFQELFEVKAIPASLILLVLAISYGGVLTFVAVYATELRLPFVTRYFFVVMAGASVISRFATGRLFESLGLDCAVYLAIATLGGGLLMLGGIHATVWMLVAAVLIGVGFGMAVPSLQTLAIQLSPAHRISAVTATFFSCLDGGIGLGAYLLGGGIHLFGYSAVYVALGVVNCACLLAYYLMYGRGRGAEVVVPR